MHKDAMTEAILELIPEDWGTVRVYARRAFRGFDERHLLGVMSREAAAAELAGDKDDLPCSNPKTIPDAEEGAALVNGVLINGLNIRRGDNDNKSRAVAFVFPEQPAAADAPFARIS